MTWDIRTISAPLDEREARGTMVQLVRGMA
jgi:hypothetical protein